MIILVTGATAGFGESITRRFIANGHKVIATGRREKRLKMSWARTFIPPSWTCATVQPLKS